MVSARRLYRLQVGLVAIGVAAVGTGLVVALSRIDLGVPSAETLLAEICMLAMVVVPLAILTGAASFSLRRLPAPPRARG